MTTFKTSYPNHEVVGNGTCYAPLYYVNGKQHFYYVKGVAVVRKSYEAAWNYIASRNNPGMNRRAKRNGVRI